MIANKKTVDERPVRVIYWRMMPTNIYQLIHIYHSTFYVCCQEVWINFLHKEVAMDGRMLIPIGVPEKAAAQEIMNCNEMTSRYGLVLTQVEALVLAQTRGEALKRAGRVEFGGGAMQALITAFCDSPYITQAEYPDTLCELARIFYDFKTDSLDEVDDAVAIVLMRKAFDEWCGSADMVESRMEALARNVRYGRDAMDFGEDDTEDDAEEDEADE